MTDSEILKALEYRINNNADRHFAGFVLDLINRQKEMIDGLIAGQETLQKCIAEKDAEIEELKPFKAQVLDVIRKNITETKSEAINDFAKMLIDKSKKGVIYAMDIPDYAKEMKDRLEIKETREENEE